MRELAGIDLGRESVPDATKLLKFRRLLEQHDLTSAILAEVNAHLTEPESADSPEHGRRRHQHRSAEFDQERGR